MQFGKETVNGTAVAADTVLVGEHQPITPDITNEIIQEDIGVRAEGFRARNGDVKLVTDAIRIPHAYYQALPALLSCGVKGSIGPSEQTSGEGDYEWDFDPSMTASNSIDSLTLELGDDDAVLEREYLMFEGYRIQWEVPQQRASSPVLFEGQYFARQNTDTTGFTAALSLPSTENLVGKLFRYYRDTSWAGLGGTEKTGALRGADIQLFTGVHPKFMGGANKYFDSHGENELRFTAAITFEGGTEADAVRTLMEAATKSFVRLEASGAQIGSGVNHKFTLDLAGFWVDVVQMDGEDRGNNLWTAMLYGMYDTTGGKVYRTAVITDVSAI